MNEQTFTVSNPRKEGKIEDYPLGGFRGTAVFTHEVHPTRGERISRVTPKRNGGFGKPKRSIYADVIRLVDGSDGKTHLLSFSSGFIQVRSCNMKQDDFCIFEGDDNFEEYRKMLFAE